MVLWGATDFGQPHFSADILWRTGFKAPDPFFLVDIHDEGDIVDFGKSYLLIGPLELERAAKETEKDIEIVNAYDYKTKSRGCLENFLKKHSVKKIIVPDTFPCGMKDNLAKSFKVAKEETPFYSKRAVKTDWEIKEIEKAQRAVEVAVKKGIDYLRSCRIIDKKIIYVSEFGDKGGVATSKSLRKIIDGELYRQGYLGIHSIVACGKQAADPHCEGKGPLYAHQPIVMDIFPCSMETNYWADMTRTVFKGGPSIEMMKMYNEVLFIQNECLKLVKEGYDGKIIYDYALRQFELDGYPTEMKKRPMEGFIHGVGHGVGIDIHESPCITSVKWILQEGNIVTVEPGLYYQKARGHIPVGGIRIEDMVLLTKTGCRNLTKFPKDLESMIIP